MIQLSFRYFLQQFFLKFCLSAWREIRISASVRDGPVRQLIWCLASRKLLLLSQTLIFSVMKNTHSVDITRQITTFHREICMMFNPKFYLLARDEYRFPIFTFRMFQNMDSAAGWIGLLAVAYRGRYSIWRDSVGQHETVQKPLPLVLGKGESSQNECVMNREVFSRRFSLFPHTQNLTIYLKNLTINTFLFQGSNESVIYQTFSLISRHLSFLTPSDFQDHSVIKQTKILN